MNNIQKWQYFHNNDWYDFQINISNQIQYHAQSLFITIGTQEYNICLDKYIQININTNVVNKICKKRSSRKWQYQNNVGDLYNFSNEICEQIQNHARSLTVINKNQIYRIYLDQYMRINVNTKTPKLIRFL